MYAQFARNQRTYIIELEESNGQKSDICPLQTIAGLVFVYSMAEKKIIFNQK